MCKRKQKKTNPKKNNFLNKLEIIKFLKEKKEENSKMDDFLVLIIVILSQCTIGYCLTKTLNLFNKEVENNKEKFRGNQQTDAAGISRKISMRRNRRNQRVRNYFDDILAAQNAATGQHW